MHAPSSSSATTATVEAAVAAVAVLMTVAVDQKIKKTTATKRFEGMVFSSFNIQYQSTGIGSLSSLNEIELKRSLRGLLMN